MLLLACIAVFPLLQALNATNSGPLDCNPEFAAPIRGGPYGGFAFTMRGNAQITSRSGRVAEVGRLEYTPFFLAVAQQMQASRELPYVRGGGLELRFKSEQGGSSSKRGDRSRGGSKQ